MQDISAAIGPRQCAADDCEKALRRDNRDGFCRKHKSKTSQVAPRSCAHEDCDKPLRISNKSGFCFRHADETPNVKARNETKRAATTERRVARPQCARDDCTNLLRSDNKTGRCREHTDSPEQFAECSYGTCTNRLNANNETGRCEEHRAKHWVAQRCSEETCDAILNEDNVTGRCHEHRGDYRRDYMLWRLYKLTPEQHDAMLAEQHGLCALCGNPPDPNGVRAASRLHVDHDHESKQVRQLLCLDCNRGLGAFLDNPDLLRKAADYLDHHAKLASEAEQHDAGLLF
jgi:hypothetical protein